MSKLLMLIERVEQLQKERSALDDDIKEVFSQAKSEGFDVKTMRTMIRERKQTPEQRAEEQALAEIYRAALGMLDGTPLGESARARLMKPYNPSQGELPEPPPDEVDPPPAAPEPATPEDLEAARAAGALAAITGSKITDNPHPAGDARRGAWDEGWCASTGSDGMDVPAAFRRAPKPTKPGAQPPGGK